jgi:acyl dehydratase
MNRELTIERTLTQADFDAFARLSGDANPIHVDPEFAARTRFGRTVSHGALLYSILRGLIEQLAPGARQLRQHVTFPAPTFADEPMRFTVRIVSTSTDGIEFEIEAVRIADGTVTCVGESLVETSGRVR